MHSLHILPTSTLHPSTPPTHMLPLPNLIPTQIHAPLESMPISFMHDTGHTISVEGFHSSFKTVNHVPIVTAAIAYDDPTTLHTYILFFHQSLYFESMERHLLCPAQMRFNQITVNDIPLLHLPFDQRTPTDHSIITQHPHPSLHIPLRLHGSVTSYFECRKPTLA